MDTLYRLFLIGAAVAAGSSVVVQFLVRPYVQRIREAYRAHVLRFAPVAVNLALAAIALPALLRLDGINLDAVGAGDVAGLVVLFGVVGGAGSKLAFDFWRLREIFAHVPRSEK